MDKLRKMMEYEISIKDDGENNSITVRGSKPAIIAGFSTLVSELEKSGIAKEHLKTAFDDAFKTEQELFEEILKKLKTKLEINEEE